MGIDSPLRGGSIFVLKLLQEKEKVVGMNRKKYSLWDNLHYTIKGMCTWGKSLVPLQMLGVLVDSVELFVVPVLVKLLIQQLELKRPVENVLWLIGGYALVILAVYVLQGIVTNQTGWRMKYVLMRFKRELMNSMLTMDYANLENPKVLDEHERIRNVMNNKDAGIEGMMYSSVKCEKFILQIIIAGVLISRLSLGLVLILSGLLALAFVPINRAKRKDKAEVWDALGGLWRKHFNLGFLTNRFDAAKEIRIYGMKDFIYKKYLGVNAAIQEKYVHSRNIWAGCHSIVKLLEVLQEIFLYAFLIYHLAKGNLSVADFTLYISAVHIFSRAVNDFTLEFADIKKQSYEVADFRNFIDTYTVEDTKGSSYKEQKPDFEYEDVTFCYQGQEKNALEHINIKIPYGQRLAVVGLNGAGKTTFIKLLCGLYEPSEGQIMMDGKDMRKYEKAELISCFSAVFQNVEVYPFSVAENVSMQQMEETDLEKVKACLKKCGLSEKVEGLKYKEQTQMLKVLDAEGVDFSGGEKQKLALARALYKEAPIIVLDEPTAALDPLAEERLYRAFDELIGEKTGIYISHRLSSTRFCDKIAMFEDGKIVEYGTHDELIALKGAYYELYETQAQYYREEETEDGEE